MPITANILRPFANATFIETGTFKCEGVFAALEAGFARIVTIEIAPELHAAAQKRFLREPRVTALCGSSAELLRPLLDSLDGPATFWLDAHGYAGDGSTGVPSPLLAKLDAIACSEIRTHTILIDDFNVFDRGFRSNVTEEQVRARLRAINPHYLLVRMDNPHLPWDILGALPWP